MDLVARGHSNREIAARLGITEDGVKAHIRRLLDKYGVPNRTALVRAVAQPSPQISLQELVRAVTDTLAEMIGGTAAGSMVRRAVKHAGQRDPDFPTLRARNARATPEDWADVRGEAALRAFSVITRELWPLLLASSGEVLVRNLERHGVSGAGVVDEDEVTAWPRRR